MINDAELKNYEFNPVLIARARTQNLRTANISSFSLYQTYINSRECPHCGSHHVVSKGNYKGRKRYLCRDCGKSFNNLTNTPFSGIHNLKKVKKYLECMINGDSIRKSADIVEVSVTTSFHWRHKLLNALNKLPSPGMKNVKEMLELELPYSHKGQKHKLSNKMRRSKVSALFVCDRRGKLDSDSIIYSKRDQNPVLKRISKISNQHSEIICLSKPRGLNILSAGQIKINSNNSNYTNSDLIRLTVKNWESWMKRFKGVATKYLRNYLHWYDFLDNSSLNSDKISSLVVLMLVPFQI